MPKIVQYNERAILIQQLDSPFLYLDPLKKLDLEIVELVPSYSEILIVFKKNISDLSSYIKLIQKNLAHKSYSLPSQKLLIPICFDEEFAWDKDRIEHISTHPFSDLVKHLTNNEFQLAFMGFLPGFPYFQGLHKKFIVPRHASPRHLVPQGSLAIAEYQIGIYPAESPAGWNLIGRCPIEIFDIKHENPSVFQPGDLVKFHSISKEEFQDSKWISYSRKDLLR